MPTDGESAPFELTRDQRELLAALTELDKQYHRRCADMFVGALGTLADTRNPDRMAQCAVSMRGLLDTVPECHPDAPKRASGVEASKELRTIADGVTKAQAASGCYVVATEVWNGEIDPALHALLIQVTLSVTKWRNQPTRRMVSQKFFRSVRAASPVSPETEDDVLKRWKGHNEFFSSSVHHGPPRSQSDMEREVDGCTSLLLRVLRIPTFEKFDALDQIIEEGEANA